MRLLRIVEKPIELRMLDEVVGSGDGGVVTFLGIVREESSAGRLVRALWYESFETMALREFESIATEACVRFGDVTIGIVHRIGEVRAGEIAVAVVAAAAHRAAAFDACRYAIDELKLRAPIWKKECYADGSAQWRSGA
ncbi:MAG: molybdenum cofactor biosynthesis protein MoaE [Candidatus Cybelea sp.]